MIKAKHLNDNARVLLSFTALQYMLDTISENPKLADIYLDSDDKPETCIVVLKHIIFIGGAFEPAHMTFLLKEIISKDATARYSVLYVFADNEKWLQEIEIMLKSKTKWFQRSLYHRNPSPLSPSPRSQVARITSKLLATASNTEMIIDEVTTTGTYENMEAFFDRGIGFAAVIGGKVCGFCTSEYPSEKSIAIGIEVLEEYQHQGLAKAMTTEFLNESARRNLFVYWECWSSNTPSIRTALACGFEKVAEYPLLFIDLSK